MAAALIRAAALAGGASLALTCCQSCSGRTLGGARSARRASPERCSVSPPACHPAWTALSERGEYKHAGGSLFITSPAKDLLISTGLIIIKKNIYQAERYGSSQHEVCQRRGSDVLNISRCQSSFNVTFRQCIWLLAVVGLCSLAVSSFLSGNIHQRDPVWLFFPHSSPRSHPDLCQGPDIAISAIRFSGHV